MEETAAGVGGVAAAAPKGFGAAVPKPVNPPNLGAGSDCIMSDKSA